MSHVKECQGDGRYVQAMMAHTRKEHLSRKYPTYKEGEGEEKGEEEGERGGWGRGREGEGEGEGEGRWQVRPGNDGS